MNGKVHPMNVRLASGNGSTILKGLLQLLIPLEVNIEDKRALKRTNKMEIVAKNSESLNTLRAIRSRRNAAVIGEVVRKDNP